MKNIKLFLVILIAVFTVSCSSKIEVEDPDLSEMMLNFYSEVIENKSDGLSMTISADGEDLEILFLIKDAKKNHVFFGTRIETGYETVELDAQALGLPKDTRTTQSIALGVKPVYEEIGALFVIQDEKVFFTDKEQKELYEELFDCDCDEEEMDGSQNVEI